MRDAPRKHYGRAVIRHAEAEHLCWVLDRFFFHPWFKSIAPACPGAPADAFDLALGLEQIHGCLQELAERPDASAREVLSGLTALVAGFGWAVAARLRYIADERFERPGPDVHRLLTPEEALALASVRLRRITGA